MGNPAVGVHAVITPNDPIPYLSPSPSLPGIPFLSQMAKNVLPPPWERASSELKALYATLSLLNQFPETAHTFSVNLTSERVQEAFGNERGPLDHLRRELVRKLEKALSRPVHMWVVIETKPSKDYALSSLHLHGAIGLTGAEVDVAREVFHNIARDWHPQTAVVMEEVYSAYWGGYSTKDVGFTSLRVDGGCFSVTRELSARARAIYDLHAEAIRGRLRCPAKAPGKLTELRPQ